MIVGFWHGDGPRNFVAGLRTRWSKPIRPSPDRSAPTLSRAERRLGRLPLPELGEGGGERPAWSDLAILPRLPASPWILRTFHADPSEPGP